jgi:hypothetical protein
MQYIEEYQHMHKHAQTHAQTYNTLRNISTCTNTVGVAKAHFFEAHQATAACPGTWMYE